MVLFLGANRYEEHDNEIIFPTICHNENADDASMKLYYYKNTKLFHCYSGCDETFDIYQLFEKRYQLIKKEYNYVNDIIGVIKKDYHNYTTFFEENEYKKLSDNYKKQFTEIQLTKYNKNILSIFEKYYTPEWLNDGITIDAMNKFNILYSINQNKIIIPHYDIDNNLIGIRARSLNEEDIQIGKYMPIKIEGKIYAHPLAYNLYGLNLNKEAIARNHFAIVYESEKSVLLQEGLFNNNSVAVCGSNFNKFQIQTLVKCGAEEIIIAFDKEYYNNQEKEQYFYKLWNKIIKYKQYCKMSFIIDNENLLNLKDSPIDRGHDILMQLLKKRVKVGW